MTTCYTAVLPATFRHNIPGRPDLHLLSSGNAELSWCEKSAFITVL